MAIPLQLRRGTTAQHTTFTGAVGEVTVDTDKDTLIVHDGTTTGGFQVAKTTKTSTDNAIARFDGTTGAIQNSVIVVDDWGNETVSGVASVSKSVNELNGNIGITGWALKYTQNVGNGYHSWSTSSNTTAGQAITYVERMRIDSSGNVGIGVTPSAWGPVYKTIDIGNFTGQLTLYGRIDGTNNVGFTKNAYRNSSNAWVYKANGYAFFNEISSGGSYWHTAPSGTAGNPITWTTALAIPSTGGIQLPNTAIANATTLDWYEEATATLTATGMTTSPTGTATFTRVGNTVTLTIPSITGTSNESTFTLTGVPTNFRPSTSRGMFLMGTDNNINTFINGILAINGTITLYTQTGTNGWSSSGTKATKTMTVQYHI